MRPPASASENRTHGAEKIGPSRYSDFFNRIGPVCQILQRNRMSALEGKAAVMRTFRDVAV